jgi:hypothetical protein
MSFALLLLTGCGQDLLLLGDITGLASVGPVPQSLEGAVPMAAGTPEPAPITPALLDPIPNGGVIEAAAEPAAPPPVAEKFNPISVPEGPREGDGVRWEGVKVKGATPPPISSRMSKSADRDFQR